MGLGRLDLSSSGGGGTGVETPRLIERRRRRGLLGAAAAALAVVVIGGAGVQVRNLVQGIADRAGGGTVDRSGPVLLQSVNDLSRYQAATGSSQLIVDLQKHSC